MRFWNIITGIGGLILHPIDTWRGIKAFCGWAKKGDVVDPPK